MSYKYKIRVRLIILHDNQILLEFVTDENFYFYPGGKVEDFETIQEAANREMLEELDVKFNFSKILYIREFIKPEKGEHSLELFILGSIDQYTVSHNLKNPDYKPNHIYKWFDIDSLPENLLPSTLTPRLIQDFHAGFPNQGIYLGAVK